MGESLSCANMIDILKNGNSRKNSSSDYRGLYIFTVQLTVSYFCFILCNFTSFCEKNAFKKLQHNLFLSFFFPIFLQTVSETIYSSWPCVASFKNHFKHKTLSVVRFKSGENENFCVRAIIWHHNIVYCLINAIKLYIVALQKPKLCEHL